MAGQETHALEAGDEQGLAGVYGDEGLDCGHGLTLGGRWLGLDGEDGETHPWRVGGDEFRFVDFWRDAYGEARRVGLSQYAHP